jgi:hypothetical protein
LVKNLRYKASAETHDRVLGNVMRALDESEKQKAGADVPDIWRIIMKSPVTKIAAAVVVITGVLIAMHFMGLSTATVTFADVVKPILNAKTAVLDIIVGDEEAGGPVIHDQIKGPLIRRTYSHIEDVVQVIDLEASRILSLTISKKEAAYVDLKGLPSMPNYLEMLRNIIKDLQESTKFEVEELGIQEIDGQEAIGFLARHPRAEITIWANPETALPIRIEQMGGQMKIICKNFKFDVPMDESLFSMVVPEGYKLQEVELDLMGSTEEDFIEGLRIRAEVVGSGQFPDSVAVEDFVKEAPLIEKKIEELELGDEEETELGMKLSKHLLFIRFFKGQGKWHYGGAGVKLGDAEKAIFWYQPKDSETWRVIYGDLRVEDVAEEDLPDTGLSNAQIKIIRSSEQLAKQEFTGTEKDVWHVTSSGNIVAHSDITLTKIPQNTSIMYIKLPYSSAELKSVTVDGKSIPFSGVTNDRYELELPATNLAEGLTRIECIWNLPLEALKKVDKGYRVRLQGLIPVEGFELTAVLDPDCGFEHSKNPSKTRIPLFKTVGQLSMSDNASCLLSIRNSKQPAVVK